MRRLTVVLAVLGVAAMAFAPSAFATFHLTRVNEVMTSNQGTGAQQFVELTDPGEPYPAAAGPYWLVVYDAAGAELGSQQLSNTALATDSAQGPMLISTAAYDAAAGTSGEFTLTVALPSAAGQACFAHEAGKAPVHCMTWGAIGSPVAASFAAASGAPPGDGLSLQRGCDGSAAVAAPTPGAANAEVASCGGKAPVPAPTPGGGGGEGGGTGTGSGGGASPDRFAGVVLRGRSAQASPGGVVRFKILCSAAAGGGCAGRASLRDGSRSVAKASFSLAAGQVAPVSLRLRGSELQKLRSVGAIKLRLAISAHDRSGTAAPAKTVGVTVR